MLDRHKWRNEYEAEVRAVYEEEGKTVDEALIDLILAAFDVGWYSLVAELQGLKVPA